MWKVAAGCDSGSRHKTNGEPCGDAVWAQVITDSSGAEALAICVADGAGSAKHGHQGATEAVAAAANFLTARAQQSVHAFEEALAHEVLEAIQVRVRTLAAEEGTTESDYATTFQLMLVGTTETLVMQVGDGGVVLDFGDGLELVPPPPSGEYVNQTQFITDTHANKVMVVHRFPTGAKRVASFTDGLTRLALNLADGTPHQPFFQPLFDTLKATELDRSTVETALVRFLASESVESRTDDDKTLALALLKA